MKTLMLILLIGFVLWCNYADAGLCSWICRSVCPIPGVCHVACKLLCTDPVSVSSNESLTKILNCKRNRRKRNQGMCNFEFAKTYIFPLPNPE